MNIYSRRSFIERCSLAGAGLGLAALTTLPPFIRRALAEGNIGTNGKKLLFVFLRGAQDGLQTLIPVLDDSYSEQRPSIFVPRVDQTSSTDNTGGEGNYNTPTAVNGNGVRPMFDPTVKLALGGADRTTNPTAATYSFDRAIPTGNGWMGLHPSAKFLAPVFNDGDLALVHRVAYPRQSRSHFDSQIYWENGVPQSPAYKQGVFYRTMLEAIQNSPAVASRSLTGVSFQNQLPLLLRGSDAAMVNLSDPSRFSLLGVPDLTNASSNSTAGRIMNTNALLQTVKAARPTLGANRSQMELLYESYSSTLKTFAEIDFTDGGANTYTDPTVTDGDTVHNASTGTGYNLFPVSNGTNGGYTAHGNIAAKYVIPTNQYGFMRNLKAAALVLGKTEATIAGTEIGGWDTHNGEVASAVDPVGNGNSRVTGNFANLIRTISWSMYSLKRFFSNPAWSPNCSWNDVVVVYMTEFGRTSAQNNNLGTDHAEANVCWIAGGNVNGGIYATLPGASTHGSPSGGETFNGKTIGWTAGTGGQNGTMFGVQSRYLQRAVDFRSILGEIIRDHLGADDSSGSAQLSRIIPGYATAGGERTNLKTGGTSPIDGTTVFGELGLIS